MYHYISKNPHTRQILKTYPTTTELSSKLDLIVSQQKTWSHSQSKDRSFQKLGLELSKRRDEAAKLMSVEMGKPILQSYAEIDKCVLTCEHISKHLDSYLRNIKVSDTAYVKPLPLGNILAVMPWNFPFWQVIRASFSAHASGNSLIVKHAPNTPQCALLLEEIFIESGFPYLNVFLSNEETAQLIADDRIHAVTLTGSERAGSAVAKTAGEHLKKCVLELGGSDPFVICEDANIELAIQNGFKSRMINNAQSCIAAKRIFAHESIYEDVKKGLLKYFKNIVTGDPLSENTTLGPLAREDLAEEYRSQISETTQIYSTTIPQDLKSPCYVEACIIESNNAHDKIMREEIFGPAMILCSFQSDSECIEKCNATPYGLASSVWTADKIRAIEYADQLDAGATFVNQMVASDPGLPFGGVKKSGYGRELGYLGPLEFCNLKTIVNNL